MEVTLRKTKITASILKQMEPIKKDELFSYSPIGWVMIIIGKKKIKKAILSNGVNCKVFSIPLIVEVKNNYVVLKYNDGTSGNKLENTEMEALRMADQIKEVSTIALQKGQIFY